MLSQRARILAGLLRSVGNFNPKRFNTSFSERLKFQKTVYIMKAFGIDLGHHYSWYIHGPYSSMAASDGYELSSNLEAYHGVSRLIPKNKKIEQSFSRFLSFISPFKEDADKLELLASLLFLIRERRHMSKEDIYDKLRADKWVPRDEFEWAWRILQSTGFIAP